MQQKPLYLLMFSLVCLQSQGGTPRLDSTAGSSILCPGVNEGHSGWPANDLHPPSNVLCFHVTGVSTSTGKVQFAYTWLRAYLKLKHIHYMFYVVFSLGCSPGKLMLQYIVLWEVTSACIPSLRPNNRLLTVTWNPLSHPIMLHTPSTFQGKKPRVHLIRM